jgi:hypothetical protein
VLRSEISALEAKAEMDATADSIEEYNPATRRIFSRAIKRNKGEDDT